MARKTAPLSVPDAPEKDQVNSVGIDCEKRRIERGKLLIEAFTLAAVVFYGIVAYCQWNAMLIANANSGLSASAAMSASATAQAALKDARNDFREDRRPYIWLTNNGIGSPEFVMERNKSGFGQVLWDWHYANYGRSPAYNVSFRQYMKLGAQPFEISYGQKQSNSGAPIPPNKEDFATVVSKPIKPEEFEQLMTASANQGISIRLSITYVDESGVPHESSVRLNHLNTGAISYSEAEMK